MDLKSKFRHVMDFPKEGIDFIDITTVLQDPEALKYSLDAMKESIEEFGDFDLIVAPEARGFIFGMPLAYMMEKGFIPVRKPGKLPYKTISFEYSLEYGTNTLEIHEDATGLDFDPWAFAPDTMPIVLCDECRIVGSIYDFPLHGERREPG